MYRARRQPKCAKERRCIKRHRNNSDPLFVFLRNSFHTKTARPRPWPGLLALSLAACPAEALRLAQMPCTPAAPRRTLQAERRCTLVDRQPQRSRPRQVSPQDLPGPVLRVSLIMFMICGSYGCLQGWQAKSGGTPRGCGRHGGRMPAYARVVLQRFH